MKKPPNLSSLAVAQIVDTVAVAVAAAAAVDTVAVVAEARPMLVPVPPLESLVEMAK